MSEGVPCVTTVAEARKAIAGLRALGGTVGLVPTMGALHEGHLSLVRAARGENEIVVVTIFVNPTQFGPNEDFERYPRDLDRDRRLCLQAGADLVFCPTADEMYQEGHCSWVDVEGLTTGLCGRSRPGHFRGVCTVVTKLFNICRPDRAYFGEKDAQQLAVIERMVRDLNMPLEIVRCPTVREPDGLAMSSRNQRLTSEERAQAPLLFSVLTRARESIASGVRDALSVRNTIHSLLAQATLGEVDYVEIVRADDLAPVANIEGECLIALAVHFRTSGTRLIDNIRVAV